MKEDKLKNLVKRILASEKEGSLEKLFKIILHLYCFVEIEETLTGSEERK